MESIALFYLESALDSEIKNESTALYHESAILFENLSYLYLEEDLAQPDSSELNGHRFIIFALSYFLAGYEANAIVMTKEFLNDERLGKNVVNTICALLIGKQLAKLRNALAQELIEAGTSEIISQFDTGEIVFGDILFKTSVRTYLLSVATVQHWIRTGNQKLIEDAIGRLNLCTKSFNACGRILDSMIVRLLIKVLAHWIDRSAWQSLKAALNSEQGEIWRRYIRLSSTGKYPLTEFWRSQLDLITPLMNIDRGLVVSMPTSAGKSRIAEIAILNELSKNDIVKVIYVVPTRSLATEIEQALLKRLHLLGYSVSSLFGGYELSQFEEELLKTERVLVVTPEKLDLLIRQDVNFLSSVALVIIDEGHQVGEGTRGLRQEFIISRIRWHSAKSGITKLLLLSAVLPNGKEISKWIVGNEDYSKGTDWKPTRIRELAFQWGKQNPNDGQLLYLESFDDSIEKFVPGIIDRKQIKNRDDVLAALALHFIKTGPVLVFSIKPTVVDTIAENILSRLNTDKNISISGNQNKINYDIIPQIAKTVGSNHHLIACLKHGFAFHYGPLPKEVRRIIENAVREGLIPLIIANETLAQGVNLPIKTLVVDTVNRGDSLMAVRDFWNIAGRTGRAAQEIEGTLVFLPDNDWNWPRYLGPYLSRDIEPCESVILQESLKLIFPNYREWFPKWKERWGEGKFVNPWPIICSISIVKVRKLFGEEVSDRYSSQLFNKLSDKLAPENARSAWQSDKWNWHNIFLHSMRQIFAEEKELAEIVNIDKYLKDKFQDIVDSQIIALTAEEILDPDKSDSIDAFLPYTLLSVSKISTEEIKRAYGTGLYQRLAKVINLVPEANLRRIYNKTGLSISGSSYLSDKIDFVTGMLAKWMEKSITWNELILAILKVVDGISDLKPKRGQKRTIECMYDWLNGRSIHEIGKDHFKNNIEKTIAVVDSISGLIPWGINSLFTLMKGKKTDLDFGKISSDLANLPALVAYGVPTSSAAYAYSFGVTQRDIAIILGTMFEKESKKQSLDTSYPNFRKWFDSLSSREPDLAINIKDSHWINKIMKISIDKAHGALTKSRQIKLKIDSRYIRRFANSEEVLLHVEYEEKNPMLSILDYLFNKRLSVQIDADLAAAIKKRDYIAVWNEDGKAVNVYIQLLEEI
jgi:hypothetical protein